MDLQITQLLSSILGRIVCFLIRDKSIARMCWAITGDQNILYKTINGGTSWDSINTSYIPKPLTDLRSDAKWLILFISHPQAGI